MTRPEAGPGAIPDAMHDRWTRRVWLGGVARVDDFKLAPAHETGGWHGFVERADIHQHITGRIKRNRGPAHRHAHNPCACGDDGERRGSAKDIGIKRGVGIMDPAQDRRSRPQPRRAE